MAQYRLHDKDEWVVCPFDRAEVMPAKTLPYHLMRCPKQHNMSYGTCPFNARHRVKKAELRHHIATCPDRAIIEPELGYAMRKAAGQDDRLKGCTDNPIYADVDIPCTEDWDAEAEKLYRERSTFCQPAPSGYVNFRYSNRSDTETQPSPGLAHHTSGWEEDNGTSNSAMTIPQPRPQPVDQPVSSVFAYSIGRGRGRSRGRGLPASGGIVLGRGMATSIETWCSPPGGLNCSNDI